MSQQYANPPPEKPKSASVEQREPCPDRILDDVGGAFAMGALGGGAWHLIKGLRNSPPSYRIRGAIESIRKESPRLGGSFANWGMTFSLFDCSLMYLRKKEDPWNAIGAGALTGGFLQLRFGLKSAARSAAFGGFLLALIEGLGIALNKMMSPPPPGVPFNPNMGGPPPPGSDPRAQAGQPGAPPPPPAGGGMWSFFGGEPPKPTQEPKIDLTEDPFQTPQMPEFNTNDRH